MIIKDLGPAVVSVWDGLRPITKKMVAGAMRSGNTSTNNPAQKFLYDAHADWELSRLLLALDEQSRTPATKSDSEKLFEITELAETCVRLLEAQSGSAEVFIQLAERALKKHDYNKLDKLSDRLFERFSAAENRYPYPRSARIPKRAPRTTHNAPLRARINLPRLPARERKPPQSTTSARSVTRSIEAPSRLVATTRTWRRSASRPS
jgi:hypothetical protein